MLAARLNLARAFWWVVAFEVLGEVYPGPKKSCQGLQLTAQMSHLPRDQTPLGRLKAVVLKLADLSLELLASMEG